MICTKCKQSLPEAGTTYNFCPFCGKCLTPAPRKTKSRPNGSGCAYRSGRTWTAQVVVGYRELPPLDLNNPANLRQRVPIKRTKSGFPTRQAALEYCPTLRAGGVGRPTVVPRLDYYWTNYEQHELPALSTSKQTAYRIAWEKLRPLHTVQIDQLTVTDLRDCVSGACTTYYTAKDARTVLTKLFALAAADGYVNKDLPSFIRLPGLTEQEREPFTDLEQTALWRLYESGDIRAAIPLLMIYTGMMPAETHGLTVDMIHLDERQIIGAGKKTAVRRKTPVSIAAVILPVLEDLIAHARPSGRLFPASEDVWRRDYYAALEAAGCRRLTPYSCRHTTATALAVTEGIAPQTVQKVMRWSSTRMMDRYVHPDQGAALAAVDALGSNVGSRRASGR